MDGIPTTVRGHRDLALSDPATSDIKKPWDDEIPPSSRTPRKCVRIRVLSCNFVLPGTWVVLAPCGPEEEPGDRRNTLLSPIPLRNVFDNSQFDCGPRLSTLASKPRSSFERPKQAVAVLPKYQRLAVTTSLRENGRERIVWLERWFRDLRRRRGFDGGVES